MQDKKIRIGVMGCASIAERSMIPAIKALKDHFVLIAVASRTQDKATALAKLFDCEGVCGYESLLEREDIDAVYLPLPSGLLHEWIPKSIKAGKHVYAEKSIALDNFHCSQMLELAKENDRALMEGFMFQYHSQHQQVKEIISSGTIGELRHFTASFGFPPLSADNFRYDPHLGGGALYDTGAYPIRATYFLLGDEMKVKGASIKRIDSGSAALFGSAFLQGPNGVGASISFGFDNYYQCNYSLWGSKGKLTAERAYTPPPDLKPKLILETDGVTTELEAKADNHFEKAMLEFHNAIFISEVRVKLYKEILQQNTALDIINRLG